MEQITFIVIIFSVVIMIVFFSFYFSKGAIVKRKLRKAPVRRITDFRSGETGRVIGKIELIDHPLQAPLSHRACAAYYIQIDQRVSTGKSSHWRNIIKEERSVAFVINDGTGLACVNKKHLKSYIVQDWRARSGLMNDATPELEHFLNVHGYKSENLLGMNKSIRYLEGVLEPDETVAALGNGQWRMASELDFPDQYDRILEIVAPEGHHVYLSDDESTVKRKNQSRYEKQYRK